MSIWPARALTTLAFAAAMACGTPSQAGNPNPSKEELDRATQQLLDRFCGLNLRTMDSLAAGLKFDNFEKARTTCRIDAYGKRGLIMTFTAGLPVFRIPATRKTRRWREMDFEPSVPGHGKHRCRGLTYASGVRSASKRYRRSARGIASMPAVPSIFFHCGRRTLTKSPSDAYPEPDKRQTGSSNSGSTRPFFQTDGSTWA